MSHSNGHPLPSRPRSFADLFVNRSGSSSDANPALVRQLVNNVLSLRSQLAQQSTDPRRNINIECGYPDLITPQMYQNAYDRNEVAARAVEVWPQESWQVQPTVYETEDADDITAFEQMWDDIGRSLSGEESWHSGEEGSPIWWYLKDADIQAGIGSYGVILLGLNDGPDFSKPAAGFEEQNSMPSGGSSGGNPFSGLYTFSVNAKKTKGRELLYIRVFPETQALITGWESNPTSPRYRQPVSYQLTFADPSQSQSATLGLPISTQRVHWSRVVHVAEGNVIHIPRMRPVFNRLLDVQKTLSSDAEAFYKNCLAKLILELPVALQDALTDTAGTMDSLEQFWNSMQPGLILSGYTAKTLPPVVVDPTSHFNVQIQAIAMKLGVPQHILLGTQQGRLASASQDSKNWNKRLNERRQNLISTRIIQPFVNRLIQLGVLPTPKQYTVAWPDLETLTEQEKATAALTKCQAIQALSAAKASGPLLMSQLDILTRVFDFDEDEATVIIEDQQKEQQKQEEEDAKKQAEAMKQQQAMQPPQVPGQPPQVPGQPPPGGQPPTHPAAPGQPPGAPHAMPPGSPAHQPSAGDAHHIDLLGNSLTDNAWITLSDDATNPGQHVWVGGDGQLRPGGPKGKAADYQPKNKDNYTPAGKSDKGKDAAPAEKKDAAPAQSKDKEATKAAPQSTAKEPASPKHGSELHDKVIGRFHAHIDGQSKLDATQKEQYKAAITKVLSSMSEKAVHLMASSVKSVHWHQSTDSIGHEISTLYNQDLAPGQTINGYYHHGDARVGLDGQTSKPDAPGFGGDTKNIYGTYAHELTHAIDQNRRFSNSDEWKAAFNKEIVGDKGSGPRLSGYARTSAVEGFAEFGRLVYGSTVAKETAAKQFPNSYAYFQKHGLVKD